MNVFLLPLPKVGCPKLLEIRNPWGKSNGKKLSQIEKLLLIKGVKSPQKKGCFGANLARIRIRIRIRLYNKDQEVIQQGSGGYVFLRDHRDSPENFCLKWV